MMNRRGIWTISSSLIMDHITDFIFSSSSLIMDFILVMRVKMCKSTQLIQWDYSSHGYLRSTLYTLPYIFFQIFFVNSLITMLWGGSHG